jgi:hypothetical protein
VSSGGPDLKTGFNAYSPLFSSLLLLLFFAFSSWQVNSASLVPALTGIHVDGIAGDLNPVFDPNITRYSVIAIANEGSNGEEIVRVTPHALTDNAIEVNGSIVQSGTTVSFPKIAPGEKILIATKRGEKQTTYEIQYLPSDFPPLTAKTLGEGVSNEPIYINAKLSDSSSSYLINLDNNAVPIFYRKLEDYVFDYKFHGSTKERSYSKRRADRNKWGRHNGEIIIMDESGQDSEVVQTVGLSHTGPHDFIITDNNEFVLLSYDGVTKDLSDIGLTRAELVEESVIQIVDRATGQVSFEWRSLADIPYEDQLTKRLTSDYAHINSVDIDKHGNLLASLRGTSNVVKIERKSGRVLWVLGGKGNQFTFVNDPYSGTCGQHTATWLYNGNLLVFDNGQYCLPGDNRGEITRIVEYEIDEVNLIAKLVWSYRQPGQYSLSQGSAQRLNNGNTIIGWGRRKGPAANTLVTEVNSSGEPVFEISTVSETPVLIYRAYRFAS